VHGIAAIERRIPVREGGYETMGERDVMHVHWNDAPGEVVLCADLDELINARPGLEEGR
jgi:hypothetical protein